MRTTVTLDDDVAQLIKAAMRERDVPFKVALNDAVRAGLGRQERFVQRTYDMGKPRFDVTKALRFAAELDDEEIIRRMRGPA
jgi:hypothetical protein